MHRFRARSSASPTPYMTPATRKICSIICGRIQRLDWRFGGVRAAIWRRFTGEHNEPVNVISKSHQNRPAFSMTAVTTTAKTDDWGLIPDQLKNLRAASSLRAARFLTAVFCLVGDQIWQGRRSRILAAKSPGQHSFAARSLSSDPEFRSNQIYCGTAARTTCVNRLMICSLRNMLTANAR
jgi:hypothetical protein